MSLLGFGVRPPTPTWGTLLRLGNGNYHYWWLIVVPSVAIFFTVTVFNLVGSGLRDAMDPKLANLAAPDQPSRRVESMPETLVNRRKPQTYFYTDAGVSRRSTTSR